MNGVNTMLAKELLDFLKMLEKTKPDFDTMDVVIETIENPLISYVPYEHISKTK